MTTASEFFGAKPPMRILIGLWEKTNHGVGVYYVDPDTDQAVMIGRVVNLELVADAADSYNTRKIVLQRSHTMKLDDYFEKVRGHLEAAGFEVTVRDPIDYTQSETRDELAVLLTDETQQQQ